jgi:hypothetical protein
MYLVVEYATLLLLTAVILSLLLGVSVALLMVQEGMATIWRVSRKIASGGSLQQERTLFRRRPWNPVSIAR